MQRPIKREWKLNLRKAIGNGGNKLFLISQYHHFQEANRSQYNEGTAGREQTGFGDGKQINEVSKLLNQCFAVIFTKTRYELEQESMTRKNAESLVDQLKQQLSKLEQQLRK